MSDFYGPALPPGFAAVHSEGEIPTEHETTAACGPQLPQSREDEDSEVYGPALPPGLAAGSAVGGCGEADDDTCGPRLSGDRDVTERNQQQQGGLPPTVSTSGSDDEDFIVGPLPISQQQKEELEREQRIAGIETRAEKMMDRLSGKDKEELAGPKREEWMTELPPEVKAFGLGPRKFRSKDVELGDRSVWTDTPADRLKKQQECADGKRKKEKKETTPKFVSEKDEKLATQVEEYNKAQRPESLMEMHRKRRAEEKDGSKGVRRPFDREVDLKPPQNIVTPAKRQALMKDSSSSLRNKFSHGSQRFL